MSLNAALYLALHSYDFSFCRRLHYFDLMFSFQLFRAILIYFGQNCRLQNKTHNPCNLDESRKTLLKRSRRSKYGYELDLTRRVRRGASGSRRPSLLCRLEWATFRKSLKKTEIDLSDYLTLLKNEKLTLKNTEFRFQYISKLRNFFEFSAHPKAL